MSRLTKKRSVRTFRGGDSGGHWISYSDMMASLLLVFILAVCYSVYQYYNMLDIKTRELNLQKEELDRAQITLVEREEELEAANVTLMGKQEELAAIQVQLDQQEADLHAAQTALGTKEEELEKMQLQLAEQADKLDALQVVLKAQQGQLDEKQQQIDNLVGVRTQIIEELSTALTKANLKAAVDPDTGDILLDSAVFFETNSSNIKDSGEMLLRQFLPVYLSVLLQPQYADYVGEIIIEGHTDTAGTYISNLKLSQDRALNVATFCLEMPSLNRAQTAKLQELLTAKGRSYSDPVYNEDGTVNMDASRRVEFKFRLKDAEMINEMNRILSQDN